jgi:hypothetical protein
MLFVRIVCKNFNHEKYFPKSGLQLPAMRWGTIFEMTSFEIDGDKVGYS